MNRNGRYNVPYGFRNTWVYHMDRVRSASCKLQNARIEVGDFEINKYRIKPHDLVFLDPPYTVSHNNNGFIQYNQNELFEDRVWCLFARLGFSYMNSDRYFEMSYDYQNPDLTQQIDVFAADDETVIIIECKAAETIKDGVFKKPLEAFHGQMDGLRHEALKRFPRAKVKFIWATHNYIIAPADQKRMQEWGIAHFSDAVINYYYELVKHLGTCARYQLLGNLFANQEIRNMEDKIPAIQGEMGGHK